MFMEALHTTIKGIHLALDVKTSFDSSTPMTGSSTESSTQKPGLPLTTIIGIAEKMRRGGTCTQKLQSNA
jgi:hypothetical protein